MKGAVNIHRLANTLFAAGSAAESLRFHRGLDDVVHMQRRKLRRLLERNRDTVYGRRHDFAGIRTPADYQQRVPVAGYEMFRPLVDRIAGGEQAVLTGEKVRLLEPTGGTRSGPKWIPYTRTLKREFQAAVQAWIFDLYRHDPRLLGTRSYWSVTPVAARPGTTPAGIPVGFEDDTDYAGPLGRVLRSALAVPGDVKHLRNIRNFRHVTAYHLLRAGNLGLISVWNPTFLLLLLEEVYQRLEPLARDLFDGTVRLPEPDGERFTPRRDPPARDRARRLQEAFRRKSEPGLRDIWPALRLISCWADGAARAHAERIRRRAPGVRLQPKGLLATECVVSFPLEAAGGSVPAYRSHFFEFLPEGGGPPRLLHQLESGSAYTVAVTTGGGLYRYDLGDRVRVTHHWRGLPVIRFEGRRRLSDLVGEKLEEGHVQAVLDGVFPGDERPAPRFLLMAPERTPTGGFYTLFIEPESPLPEARRDRILDRLDAGLQENFHYRYARELGQLERPRLVVLPAGRGQQAYLDRCMAAGQRLGDIKQTVLDPRTGWAGTFAAQADPDERGETDGS